MTTAMDEISTLIQNLDFPALARVLQRLDGTEAVVHVLDALRDRPEQLEEVMLGLAVEGAMQHLFTLVDATGTSRHGALRLIRSIQSDLSDAVSQDRSKLQ